MRRFRGNTAWLAGAATVLLAVSSSCSRFEAADQQRPSTSDPVVASTEVGGQPPPTSTTLPTLDPPSGSAPSGPTATDATAVATPSAPPAPRNVASAVTDGLRVEVVAEDGPDYGSRPRFRIQVTLRNQSDRTRHYFLGQGNYAVLVDAADQVVWASGDCNPTLGVYEIHGGAAPLEPGEEVSAIVDYPQPPVDDDVGCDLPDGRYTLVGMFPLCPPEHVEETGNPGTYSCPEDSVQMYTSAGLAVTIGGGSEPDG